MAKIIIYAMLYFGYLLFCYWLVTMSFCWSFGFGLSVAITSIVCAYLIYRFIMRQLWK